MLQVIPTASDENSTSLVRSFDQEKNNIQAQQKKKMVMSNSSSENKACCSKSCKKNTESLNTLSQVKGRLVEFKNQEVKYCEKIRVLEFKVESRANCIESLTKELELIKKEKEDYSRPSPTIESTSYDLQNKNTFVTETEASDSTILSKPAIKKSSPKNNYTHKSMPPRPATHRPYIPPMRPIKPNMNAVPRSNVNNVRPKTTQDLMIILIQIVKRLEREIKARTPPTKIHKIDRGRSRSVMTWVPKKVWFSNVKGNSGTKLKDSVRTKRSRGSKSTEVVDYILQVKKKLLTKKLKDLESEHQV
nr:hypothetical protein [Tanacetum cinerariifolium]